MTKKFLQAIKDTRYIKSFKKLDKRFLFCVGIDAGYYIVMLGLVFLAAISLSKILAMLPKLIPLLVEIQQGAGAVPEQAGAELLVENAMQARSILVGTITKIGLVVLAFFVVVIAVTSAAKGTIWKIVSKKRFNVKIFLRLFLFNAVSFVIYSLIIGLIVLIFNVKVAAYLTIFMSVTFIYLKILAYPLFMKKEKLKKVIKDVWATGIKKAHILIAIYTLIILTAIFPAIILRMIEILTTNQIVISISLVICLMLYAGWARFYLYDVVDHTEKR